MKTNEWNAEQEKLVKTPAVFSGLAEERTQNPGDWLLIMKSGIGFLPREDWGDALLESFFAALAGADLPPGQIIFINKGVSLACRHSPLLKALYELEQRKTAIYASAACLEFYGLRRELCVGKMITMAEIVGKLGQTLRVVTL